jgi:hypothetical protein
MKHLTLLLRVVFGLALVVFLGTWIVEGHYAGKAQLVQRMETSAASDLFDSAGVPIGSPQRLIIEDPRAFTGEKTAEGAAIVSENLLRERGIYPLQMQTVSYVAGLTRIGSGLVGLAAGLALLWRRRRS